MNKRQKILPILALAAFAAIIALHYGRPYLGDYPHTSRQAWPYEHWMTEEEFLKWPGRDNKEFPQDWWKRPKVWRVKYWTMQHHWEAPEWRPDPRIEDVRMPLFALAVFYTGLFFILATPRAK